MYPDKLPVRCAEDPYVSATSSVRAIMDYFLEVRRTEVRPQTWQVYRIQTKYVVGPLLLGSTRDRYLHTRKGTTPADAQLLAMLGDVQLCELTTARIRQWHRSLSLHIGSATAKAAKKHLRSALAMIAEDFELHVPAMPLHRGRGLVKQKKRILTPAQIGQLLRAAQSDKARGIYYAFPFLTGVRPSEQLALFWDDIDFSNGVIRVRRTQLPCGSVIEITKTVAGMREIPLSPLLRQMLMEWQRTCPTGAENRVFPCLGYVDRAVTHKKRGSALSYVNFRKSYWLPVFGELQLPYVTPHSARHAFISTLQASGVEIGVVAKLAGHADPAVTLSHYTRAVRDGVAALASLEATYVAAMP